MVGENHAGGQVYPSSWPTAPGGARAAQYSHSQAPQRPSWQDTLHPCRYNGLPRLHPVPAQAHLNEACTATTSPKAPCLNPTDPATVAPAPSLQPAPRPPLGRSCCRGFLCPIAHVVLTSGCRRACVFPAFLNKDTVSEWPFLRTPFGALSESLGSTLLSGVLSVGRRDHTLVGQTLND